MAEAKKCDRCGKYYDKNIAKSIYGLTVTGVCLRLSGNSKDDTLDLCDECIIELYKFLGKEE